MGIFGLIRRNRKIVENFFSLSVLNVTNYIFPILIIPYLTNVLGTEYYGRYIFGYTVIHYFTLFTQYGFELSATKNIAVANSLPERREIFSSVMLLRFIFNVIAILVLLVCICCVPLFKQDKILYLYGILVMVGQTMNPFWLFQGLQEMKFITLINFAVRSIPLILVFVFVKTPDHFNYVMAFQGSGFVAGAIFSLIIAYFRFNIHFVLPGKEDLINQLKQGWSIFVSTIGMNFYRESNVIILGLMTNFSVVGLYAPAEKIIKGFQSVTSPFVNTLFPYFSRRFSENSADSKRAFARIGKIYLIFLILLTVFIVLISPFIGNILGEGYTSAASNIRILSLVIIFGGMNFYYGIIGMVNQGRADVFAKGVWISGVLSVLTCIVLSGLLFDLGASLSMVLAEVVLFFYLISRK